MHCEMIFLFKLSTYADSVNVCQLLCQESVDCTHFVYEQAIYRCTLKYGEYIKLLFTICLAQIWQMVLMFIKSHQKEGMQGAAAPLLLSGCPMIIKINIVQASMKNPPVRRYIEVVYILGSLGKASTFNWRYLHLG